MAGVPVSAPGIGERALQSNLARLSTHRGQASDLPVQGIPRDRL